MGTRSSFSTDGPALDGHFGVALAEAFINLAATDGGGPLTGTVTVFGEALAGAAVDKLETVFGETLEGAAIDELAGISLDRLSSFAGGGCRGEGGAR